MGTDGMVVTRVGGGLPPGYRWRIIVLNRAHAEGEKELTEDQYAYLAEQVQELGRQPDPSHVDHLSVDAVEDFFELRDKGGVLGKKNMRVYFSLHPDIGQTLLILGVLKKESDGAIPVGVKVTMSRRRRLWVESQKALVVKIHANVKREE